jgi:dTMP kinase
MRKNNRGKFIVIEGIDGAGKSTQTDLLVEKLKDKKYKVVTDDYPHYETGFWGRHVGRMLTKEFGNPMDISPYLTVLPYMLDEASGSREIIEPALNNGKMVVSNRYFTSNVHQIAKMPKEKRKEFSEWLWSAGYDQMKIIRPDLVLVLLVDPHICRENIFKKAERKYAKGQAMDAAEEDFNHQMESTKEYRKMIKNDKTWVEVNCCDKKGNLLKPEEINKKVIEILKREGIIKL